MTLKIGVCGAAGRMGRTILALCHETEGVKVTAAIEHDKSPARDGTPVNWPDRQARRAGHGCCCAG